MFATKATVLKNQQILLPPTAIDIREPSKVIATIHSSVSQFVSELVEISRPPFNWEGFVLKRAPHLDYVMQVIENSFTDRAKMLIVDWCLTTNNV